MPDSKDKITRTRVKRYNGKKQEDFIDEPFLYVKLEESNGFNSDDEVIVLRYFDFPMMMDLQSVSQLKKIVEEVEDNSKRVKELKQKLESAEESNKETLDEIKIKHQLEIEKLEKENNSLKKDNQSMKGRLRRISKKSYEMNEILKDFE